MAIGGLLGGRRGAGKKYSNTRLYLIMPVMLPYISEAISAFTGWTILIWIKFRSTCVPVRTWFGVKVVSVF